jgi:hypothetical protein
MAISHILARSRILSEKWIEGRWEQLDIQKDRNIPAKTGCNIAIENMP